MKRICRKTLAAVLTAVLLLTAVPFAAAAETTKQSLTVIADSNFFPKTGSYFADLSQYDRLIVRGSGSGLRIIANRLVDHGPYKQFITDVNERSTYWDSEYGVISIPLEQIAAMDDSNGNKRVDGFVHLNTIKVNSGGQLTVKGMYLVPKSEVTTVNMAKYDHINDNKYYNLNGQVVEHPVKGMYIRNGRKVVIR